MTTIQVRDVPEPVADALRRRATEAGQSLQVYLLRQLTALSERRTNAEALREARAAVGLDRLPGVTSDDIAIALRELRDDE